MNKLRIGALISGFGNNLKATTIACNCKHVDGEVVFVGSDQANAKGLEYAVKQHIPHFVIDYDATEDVSLCTGDFANGVSETIARSRRIVPYSLRDNESKCKAWFLKRFAAEKRLLSEIKKFECDLLILDGFEKLLSAFFIDQINTDPLKPRIMNIHPTLLPAFPGIGGYENTYNYGCKMGGCTVHFVDYGENTGPIIGQLMIPISEYDSLDDFKNKGIAQEWELYPQCIKLFAEGRLHIVENSIGRRTVKII